MNLKKIILNILFPPLCFGCDKNNKDYLCAACWAKIEINTSFYCPVCQSRLPFHNIQISKYQNICHPDSHYILAPATDYRSLIVQKLIQDFKYNFLTSAMTPIERILDRYIRLIGPISLISPIVVPIPLSRKRNRERGFNQAELIANCVAQKLNLPILKSAIIRIKDNSKQSEKKSWAERLENIKDCFQIINPEEIKNKNILLVDDVFTSGATINEAVKVLKSAGARKIIAFTVARAR